MRSIIATVLLFCASWGGTELTGQPSRKPVTITYKTTSFGTPERVSYFTDSYRADGSVARAVHSEMGGAVAQVEVTDLAAKRVLLKDAASRTYHESPLPPRQYAAPTSCEAAVPGPHARCFAPDEERMLGQSVQRATMSLENDRGRMEFSLAPDLNYLPLRMTFWKGSQRVSEMVAVAIAEGEPDAGVFLVPREYRRAVN
jgi:hypothetical protein